MRLFGRRSARRPAVADKVYYSTPFGDTTDGKHKAFLLERDGIQFLPVFRSAESLKEFFEQRNRAGYVMIEGSIKSVMDTICSIELLKDVRIVIDPMGEHPVEIMPGA